MYEKPGVEINQVAKSFSPTLISPDLGAAIIAPAYNVVPIDGDGSYTYASLVSGNTTNTTVNIQGLTSSHYLDKDSVIVDLVVNNVGRVSLSPEDLTGLTDGGSSFVIPSGVVPVAYAAANVYVGYRALRKDLSNVFMTLDSNDAYTGYFGDNQVTFDNPLPFALSVAGSNTRAAVYGAAVKTDDYASLVASGTIGTEHAAAMELLSTKEVYALAPYTTDSTTITAYTTHVDAMSLPAAKKERIVFIGSEIVWKLSNGTTTTNPLLADKAQTATAIQSSVYSILNRRTFNVYPDVCYFAVSNLNVQKVKPTFLKAMYDLGSDEFAILAKQYVLKNSSGTVIATYNAGTEVTEAVYTNMKASTTYKFDVLVPMPGFFMAVAIAGQVSGQQPEQGFTNLPFAGPAKLKYANDWFTESQLNTMVSGQGGAYLVVQVGSSVFSRHQMSTNATTIQYRELNITKSLDYTAKFIRNTVSGYIGRSLISPSFLQNLSSILAGIGTNLVKKGRLNGFKVLAIAQDTVNPDTVNVAIDVKPKYPVNYIKVDLIF